MALRDLTSVLSREWYSYCSGKSCQLNVNGLIANHPFLLIQSYFFPGGGLGQIT